MKALIGIISAERLRNRMMAIARGEYKPQPGEPKVWFASLNAVGQVLSNDNINLLRMMDEHKPKTMAELAKLSGRQPSNLSVTLKTLESHGFVALVKTGKTIEPKALFIDFDIRVDSDDISPIKAA